MGLRRRDEHDDEAERIFQLVRDGADDEDVIGEIAAALRKAASPAPPTTPEAKSFMASCSVCGVTIGAAYTSSSADGDDHG